MANSVQAGMFVLVFLAWVVMATGVALVHGEMDRSSKEMRQYWWGAMFQFFIVIMNLIAVIMGSERWYMAVGAFAAMSSAYLMNHAEYWILLIDGTDGHDRRAARVAAAGVISSIAVNWLLILVLGNPWTRPNDLNKPSEERRVCNILFC